MQYIFKRYILFTLMTALLSFSSCGFRFISVVRKFKHKYYSIDDSLRIFKIDKPHPNLKKYKKWYSKNEERDFDLLGMYVLPDTINLKDTATIFQYCRQVLKVQFPKLLHKKGYQLLEYRIFFDNQQNEYIKVFLESSGYSFQLLRYSNILVFQQQMWTCYDYDGF